MFFQSYDVRCTATFFSGHSVYTLWTEKTWQYIWLYNSGKTRSIFIIFALLKAGRKVLHTNEKYIHLTWIMYLCYLVKVKQWHFTLIMHSYLRLSNNDVMFMSHVKKYIACLKKAFIPVSRYAKDIKIHRGFPELWSQMCCHFFIF